MKRVFIATLTILCLLTAAAQDIIVKKDGDTLRVYDLKINAKFITYRENPGKDSPSKRIGKAKVLSVKKGRGKSVEISAPSPASVKSKQPAKRLEKDTVVYFTEILPKDSIEKSAEKPRKEPKGEVVRAVAANNTQIVAQYNKIHGSYGDRLPKKSKADCAVSIMGVTVGSVLSNEDVEIEIAKCDAATGYNIFVRNKSDKIIYLDLENSFRIFSDGTFKPYYSGKQIRQSKKSNQKFVVAGKRTTSQTDFADRRQTTSRGATYNIENRKETSQVAKEQKIISVPPIGKVALPPCIYLDENDEIVKEYDNFSATLPWADYKLSDWQVATIDEAQTPFKNSFIITYSPNKKFDIFSTVKFGLYLKQLIGLGTRFSRIDETRIQGYDKYTICGEIYFE